MTDDKARPGEGKPEPSQAFEDAWTAYPFRPTFYKTVREIGRYFFDAGATHRLSTALEKEAHPTPPPGETAEEIKRWAMETLNWTAHTWALEMVIDRALSRAGEPSIAAIARILTMLEVVNPEGAVSEREATFFAQGFLHGQAAALGEGEG